MAENLDAQVLSGDEIDAIGEIMNISMGSAATAVSTMLDRMVNITTPRVTVQKFHELSYAEIEPAMLVKIEYVEGISGSNVMAFRQSDMQIILNLLMGMDDEPSEDFVFDEMSMSAACEVMNQMMGASATALSNFLGKSINISTPVAHLMDEENTFENALGLAPDDDIVAISFDLDIASSIKSTFISVLTCDLAKKLVGQMFSASIEEEPAPPEPAPAPAQQAAPQPPAQQAPPPVPPAGAQQPMMPPQGPYGQPPQGYPPQPYGQPYPPQPPYGAEAGWQQPYGQPYPPQPYGYPPYGYPMQQMPPGQQPNVLKQGGEVNIQIPQFPSFAGAAPFAAPPLTGTNMDLMMNVPLSVSVEIGKTKKKIRDILDFNQGTVIELEKQAGAPVDIVVNGQLIARGDVVVVEDNFGVRITEIVGTKELMESISNQ